MRLSAVVVCSLLGMGGSSAAVSWLVPDTASGASRSENGVQTAAYETARADEAKPTAPAVGADAGSLAPVPEPVAASFRVPGTLGLTGRLGHSALPGDRPNETFLFVEVDAPEEIRVENRAPVNVSIVIDRSGSMKGKRLDNAVAAARGMLGRLRADDTVSLVAYDNKAQLLLPPTTVDRIDRVAFDRALSRLRGKGHTCISCGIDMARTQLARHRGEAINRILLLSDGVANRGMTKATDFRRLGDLTRLERTAVTSIGVDVDYDERPLFALSQASNGHHYFVENPSGLPAIFDREARNLVGTLADRVDVDVELAEGVELVEVIARGHRRQGDRVALSFGSFTTGDAKSALLRVRVAPGRGAQDVATVRLAYRDVTRGREERADGSLGVQLDPELATVAALDPKVDERLGRRDTQDALIEANAAFSRGDISGAQRRLDRAQSQISQRRGNIEPEAEPVIDADFEKQLEALATAKANFDDAVVSAPASAPPKTVTKSRKAKKAIRLNAHNADPFG
ncbi:MAG: VWA domain-containing protein [Myxococcota bacterium]